LGEVIKQVSGTIDLIGKVKDFGQNKRVNIKLKDSDEEWISLVSSEEVVNEFLERFKAGDKIVATCKVHEGKDYQGKARAELWIQDIVSIKKASEVVADALAVDKYFVDALKRAARIVDKAKVAATQEGRDYLIAAVFLKVALHEVGLKR